MVISKLKKDNRGFSLVELIVIILIMGVLTSGAAMSISTVYNADVDRAAKKFCSLMNVARTKAMALNTSTTEIIVKLEKEDDYIYGGVYQRVGGTDTLIGTSGREKLGNYRVSMQASGMKNGGAALADVVTAVYHFNKGDGAIILEEFSAMAEDAAGPLTTYGLDASNKYNEAYLYRDMTFMGSHDCRVIVVPATGRTYIK